MSEILAIAKSVWLRILRMPVTYFLLFCGLAIIAAMNLYGTLTMDRHAHLMTSISMLIAALAGFLAALTVAFDVPRELKDGVASNLLSKPLGRSQYLIGKLLGTGGVAAVVTGIISLGFLAVYRISFGEMTAGMIQAHVLTVISVFPITAMALLFATFLNGIMAPVLTAVVTWLGYSATGLANIPVLYGGILPDLNLFNMRAEAAHGMAIGWEYVGLALAFGIAYCVVVTAAATLVFQTRDIA